MVGAGRGDGRARVDDSVIRRGGVVAPLVLVGLACVVAGAACAERSEVVREDRDDAPYEALRARMVERQIAARDVRDERVLAALRKVPRHRFVPESVAAYAYEDRPMPIGHRQTISQPYIVAVMTEAIRPQADDKVLEIGTGSGYQAAVLAELVDHVYTIEIVEPLGEEARETLASLGYENVTVRVGDGYAGWPEEAPFDAIVVTAAPEEIPPALIEQLAEGGRLVIPVGDFFQELRLVTKNASGIVSEDLMAVRFVPMTGRAQQGDADR